MLKAIDPEVVCSKNNPLESLVIEKHSERTGISDLSCMILLVFDTAITRFGTRVLFFWSKARHKVSSSYKSVSIVVEHFQINSHSMSRTYKILENVVVIQILIKNISTCHRAMCADHFFVNTVLFFKRFSYFMYFCSVHNGLFNLHLEIFMDIMMKVRSIATSIIVHKKLLCQNIPGSISMEISVFVQQFLNDVNMNSWMQVFQFLKRIFLFTKAAYLLF